MTAGILGVFRGSKFFSNAGVGQISKNLSIEYKYKVRPGYGSTELLIEFLPDKADEVFFGCIFRALEAIRVTPVDVVDLWMNDEIIWNMKSDAGEFELSKDIWDMVFIMADNNQAVIEIIDSLLEKDGCFIKEEVDFNNY